MNAVIRYDDLERRVNRLLTQTELARELGRTIQTIINYRAAGMPIALMVRGDRSESPRFDLYEVNMWLAERGLCGRTERVKLRPRKLSRQRRAA